MSEWRGGVSIHPSEAWAVPQARVSNAFIPPLAAISLRQVGKRPARCLVSPGERVEEGQIIGRAEAPDSVNVHSSIPGVVSKIQRLRLPDGDEAEAVLIELGGSFSKLGRRQELFPWKGLSFHEILRIIGEKGVVGLASSFHPLAQALAVYKQARAEAIIIDCVDPDPFQAAQRSCALSKPEDIAMAFEILVKLTGATAVRLRHGRGEEAIVRPLETALATRGFPVSRQAARGRYPAARMEGFASKAKTDHPEGPWKDERNPVFAPTTMVALYEAVALNKPCMEQIVTVCGDAIKRPATLRARLGMSIGDLVGECGGFKGEPARLVSGGVMTGAALRDLDSPVTKTIFSVVALTAREVRAASPTACIRCGECAEACPVGLDPGRLRKLLQRGRVKEALAEGLGRCQRCAACAYACPSRVPLLRDFTKALAEEEK